MMGMEQFEYCDWLADAAGGPKLPAWRADMYAATGAVICTYCREVSACCLSRCICV